MCRVNKCSVCNKDFEDNYYDRTQQKCILHCEKDDWYTKEYDCELESYKYN